MKPADVQHAIEINETARVEGRSLLWQIWHDGGRPLIVAFVIFLGSMGLLVASALFYFLEREPDQLGNYSSPWEVLSTVPGHDGPTVEQAGLLALRGTRCAHVREGSLKVEVHSSFRRLDAEGGAPDLRGARQDRGDGCATTTVSVQLPAAVTPGLWSYEAVERDLGSGELRSYFSDPFTVVAK